MEWQQMRQPSEWYLWDHASSNRQMVEKRGPCKDYRPVSITNSCLQSAGRRWSLWHTGTSVQDLSQVKALVIRPWPVHLRFLAGLQEGLWPLEWEQMPVKRFRLSVAHSEASWRASTRSWPTIILLSAISIETRHIKTLTTTTRCAL